MVSPVLIAAAVLVLAASSALVPSAVADCVHLPLTYGARGKIFACIISTHDNPCLASFGQHTSVASVGAAAAPAAAAATNMCAVVRMLFMLSVAFNAWTRYGCGRLSILIPHCSICALHVCISLSS